MTTRLVLVRHGEPLWDGSAPASGPLGCPGLSDRGRTQAELLRDRLFGPGGDLFGGAPVAVYSSRLPRAVQTAEILAAGLPGGHAEQHCGLCTYHVSERLDGLPWSEVRRRHGQPGGGVFRPFEDGVESWADLVNRVGTTLHALALRHRDETVVAVAHTESVEASLQVFGVLPLYRGFDVRLDTASVTEWTTAEDPGAWPPARWTLTRLNDTAHLPQVP